MAARQAFHDSEVPIPVEPGLAPNGLLAGANKHADSLGLDGNGQTIVILIDTF